ncbi:LuxR family transcriptional regulator [Zhengella mangrovi]|uniref:LuxR family transcriptional regulator n=1 Tax=Zhengella mangrovi TaxID=1982044 RepID=A0A2G1QKK9_9HYPH|nr:LuxR family transcriptional regulator [Zhengella mangrovi]
MGFVAKTEGSVQIDQLVVGYSDAVEACETVYDILRVLKRITLDLGFRYFSVIRMPDGRTSDLAEISLVSNYPPELVQAYDDKKLLQTSPVIGALKSSTMPHSWQIDDVELTRTEADAAAVNDLFREFGLLAGTCFPVHDTRGRRGAVSFCGMRRPCSLEEQVQLAWLCNMIFLKVGESKPEHDRSAPKLTDRELQCLNWTAAGKTSPEIAVILELSEHTVNHYLASSAQKLSAVNRAHAVAKALRLGILE